MAQSRRIVAVLFSLLLASSMVVVPASAAFTPDASQPTPQPTDGSVAPLDAVETTTAASTLEHTTPDDLPDVGDRTPRDLDGDGRYEDVTGDGTFSNSDVIHFFGNQHALPDDESSTYFDYTGDGDVSQADVTRLFEALTAEDSTDVIVPPDADGDGLPDQFETDVAGTDPHDPNSDSTRTATNESANDVADAREDLSGNGVSLAYAAEYDLDPLANDTDRDGLSDRVELRHRGLDPATADSDGDGTDDGAGDRDGDGLSNAAEVEHGTNLDRADTDGDGIRDGDEVRYGSDPLAADTDEDGLDDALEGRFGTDPTTADSDGDGTPDGNESFDVEHSEETTGVTATATGPGAAPTELSLEHLPRYDDTSNATAGPTVLVSNVERQENVTVRVPVTTNASAADLSIYTRTPTRNGTWQEHGGEYDAAAGVATAELPGSREVTVLNATTWKDSQSLSIYEARAPTNVSVSCEGDCAIVDGSVVVGQAASDVNGSTNGTVAPQGILDDIGDAVDDVVDTVLGDDDSSDDDNSDDDSSDDSATDIGGPAPRYPPDGYDPDSTDDTAPTHDPDDYDTPSDDDSSDDDGSDDSDSTGTDNSDSDDSADDISEPRTSATVSVPTDPEVVTLAVEYSTDGGESATVAVDGASDTYHLDADATYGDSEVLIADVSAFGGEDITVSVATDGATVHIADTSIFRDSDGDGLTNAFETNSSTHPVTRESFQSDPNLADTDGDGLDDGEEVSTIFDGEEWRVDHATSDPSLADTDGDGVSDREEIDVWETDPTDPDTSGDGLNDLVDPKPNEQTTPPAFEYRALEEATDVDPFASEDLFLYVTASATGGASQIESIVVEKCWEDPPGDVRVEQDPECQEASIPTQFVDSDDVETQLHPASTAKVPYSLYYESDDGDVPKAPDNVSVTVTDDDGNVLRTRSDPVAREFELQAGIGTASAGSVGSMRTVRLTRSLPTTSGLGLFTKLSVVVGGALLIDGAVDSVGEDFEGGEVLRDEYKNVPIDEIEDQWQLSGHGTEISLPAGVVHEAPSSDARDRGFGWEYIETSTSSLTQADLEHVIEHPTDVIEQDGEVRYVIGDGTDDIEKVILGIISGTLVAASQGMERNADCEDWVQWDNDRTPDGNPEHTLGIDRDKDKWLDTVEQIENIIKDPRMILDSGGSRYYVGKTNGKWVALLLEGGDVVWELVTSLDGEGGAYDSLDDLLDGIDGNNKDTVYDPEEGINEC